MSTTIRDLTATHLGRIVRIRAGAELHEGMLTEVHAVGAVIEDTELMDAEPSYVMGAVTVRLAIGTWQSPQMSLDTEVEFL